jgi:hypothetical protein
MTIMAAVMILDMECSCQRLQAGDSPMGAWPQWAGSKQYLVFRGAKGWMLAVSKRESTIPLKPEKMQSLVENGSIFKILSFKCEKYHIAAG